MKIAIDGPAGAGKSTIAKHIAEELGYTYIDTGAMYRALAWKSLKTGINADDAKSLHQLALSTKFHFQTNFPQQILICDEKDITADIRSPEVSSIVARIAEHSAVRQIMVQKQQEMAAQLDVVMEGRDIGEKVLPEADFKFYLTASLEERAQRRAIEWQQEGYNPDYMMVKQEILARDRVDTTREEGALKILPDSIVIDTTNMDLKQVLDTILRIIRSKTNAI